MISLRAAARPLIAAGLAALAIAYAIKTPSVVIASAPSGLFSAERAGHHIRQLAQRPHPAGGDDHARVRSYLVSQLGSLGVPAHVQEATGIGTRYAAAGRVRNVIARRPGRRSGGPSVLLMAHYDGVPAAPGAGDDASGVAVLLETLRALRTDSLEHDVIALFTDAEEAGLLGAAAFVREHPWASSVAVVINFEARGTQGPSLMFETGPGNMDLVRILRRVGGGRATSLSTAVYRSLPNDTDLSEMAVLGTPALNFAFIGGVQRYHTAQDNVANLDLRSVQHHGEQALGLVRVLARDSLPRPSTGNAVFFDLPVIGIVLYPVSLAIWISLLPLVLALVAIVRAPAESRALAGTILGVLTPVLAAAVAALAGYGLGHAMQRVHAAIGSGAPEWSGLYALSIGVFGIAVAGAATALARRWGSETGLRRGAVLCWSVVSLVTGILAPEISFLFTWPVLLFAIAAAITAWRPGSRATGVLIWAGVTLSIFLLVPTLYLMVSVALGLFPVGAAILGLLVAFAATLLIMHLEGAAGPRRWTLAGIALTASLIVFGAGVLTVRSSSTSPLGSSLVYALDADSNQAWLSGVAWTPAAGAWLRRALVPRAGEDRPALPLWLQRHVDRRYAVAAPVPVPAIAAPTVTILRDSASASERSVTLRIAPARGTRAIGMRAERGAVRSARVDGLTVETDRYRRQPALWALSYTAPPDSGFTVTLTFPASSPPLLGLLSRHTGIPATSGLRIPARPPGIVAAQDGDMSMVYTRVELAPRPPLELRGPSP